MTQAEYAERLGIDPSELDDWFSEHTDIGPHEMAEVLEWAVDYTDDGMHGIERVLDALDALDYGYAL